MSGLFGTGFAPDERFEEGIVLRVDPVGNTCQVQTIGGKRLQAVTWLLPVGGTSRSGSRSTPSINDRVLVTFSTGSPIIIGSLSSVTSTLESPVAIHDGSLQVDTGDTSNINGAVADTGKPTDSVPGDHTITTEGGGILAVLRSGGVLLKSGGVVQAFLSKLDGLLRLVAKNLYIFTDVSSDASVNHKGQVYRYTGYADNPASARMEDYAYQEMFGNTAAAQVGKAKRKTMPASLPGPDGTIRKVLCGALTEGITTGGVYTRFVGGCKITHDTTSWQAVVESTMLRIDPSKAYVQYKGNTFTLDDSGAVLKSSSGIKFQASGGISLEAGGGVSMSGASISATGGGVSMNSAGGVFKVNASSYEFE